MGAPFPRWSWSLALLLGALACVVVPARPIAVGRGAPSLTFYETLSPHGTWVVVAEHGRVWKPHVHVVGPAFVPYLTGGTWVHTEAGWSFTAEWEWSWIPFHYGRWYEDDAFGWVWVPGTVWAPAWVEWRYGGGFVGWMPLPPRHHRPARRWCYVETRHFTAGDLHHHRVDAARDTELAEATAPIPPPSVAVFPDEPAWTPGPPVAALKAERLDVPERPAPRPPPVFTDRLFPRELPVPPTAVRPERAPAPPALAPVPPPDRRERLPTRPFAAPPTPLPPRPFLAPLPRPAQPIPPTLQPPAEDPKRRKKVAPAAPIGPPPPARPPPGA